MKNLFTLFAAVLLTANVFAQAPQKMSYQAVIRNSSNALVTGTAVGMRISILQGSSSGTAVYAETQTPTTNANGLVSIEIGAGTVVTGTFAGIDWSAGPYFIKTETDPAGGTSYSITGTSQLLSVPYALSAATAASITNPTGLAIPKLTTAQINALPVSPAPFGTIVFNTTSNSFVGYRTSTTQMNTYYSNTGSSGNPHIMPSSSSIKQTFTLTSALTSNISIVPQIFPSGGGVQASGIVTLKVYSGAPGSETLVSTASTQVNTAQTGLSFTIPGTIPVGPGYYTLTTDATASLKLMIASSTNVGVTTQQGYDESNQLLANGYNWQFSMNGMSTSSFTGWVPFY